MWSGFAITEDGVLAWTMTRPSWTCSYGLAVVPQVALPISACDIKPGFPWPNGRPRGKRKSTPEPDEVMGNVLLAVPGLCRLW